MKYRFHIRIIHFLVLILFSFAGMSECLVTPSHAATSSKSRKVKVKKQKRAKTRKQKRVKVRKQKRVKVRKQKRAKVRKQKRAKSRKQKRVKVRKQKRVKVRKQKTRGRKSRYASPAPQPTPVYVAPVHVPAPMPVPQPRPPLVIPANIAHAFFNQNFVKVRSRGNPLARAIDFADLGHLGHNARSNLYDATVLERLPTTPVLHAYSPGLNLLTAAPVVPLNVKLPHLAGNFITPEVERLLNASGVTLGNIDTFLCVQDMPWNGVPLLLRPQGWLSPNEPNQSAIPYQVNFNTKVAVVSKRLGGPRLVNQPANGLLDATGLLSIHNTVQNGVVIDPTLVSSGNTLHLGNMNLNNSETLYSIVVHGQRAAVTKHVLLNQADEVYFEQALNNSANIYQLRTQLANRRANFSRGDIVDDFNF